MTWQRCSAVGGVALLLAFLAGGTAAAQPEVIRCLPPDVPITALPAAVLTEYRAEIGAEFESYFAAVSTYIACLDSERDRALSEARDAAVAYSSFLDAFPDQKDLP